MVYMKAALSALAVTTLTAMPLAAQAQFAKVEDAVKYRKSAFAVMGVHFARIGAVVKGEKPFDKATVANDAAIVEMMSKLPWQAFPAGSDVPESKAKPEIWKEQDKFKAGSEKMQADVAKLSAAAKSGDLNQIKTAFGAAGQTCKSCHDNFRDK